MALWIWYPGDFEIRHGLKLNLRRQEYDYMMPAFWRLDDCWHNVRFLRRLMLDKPEVITIQVRGDGFVRVDSERLPLNMPISLQPGEHEVEIRVFRMDGLPCARVEGRAFESGEGWLADNQTSHWLPCGYDAAYASPDDDPETFHFAYELIQPASVLKDETGTLYDFGRETFAKVRLSGVQGEVRLCYGESETEARDVDKCYLRETVREDDHVAPTRAFRYLFVPGNCDVSVEAEYEYLPIPERGSFSSSDRQLVDIWNTSAYTFRLNTREFFLDGIKRDRWVWSGDAYQSFFINRCLFMDPGIVKRTLWALRGKDPIEQHINTIIDYSLYWIMAVGDCYDSFGDLAFVKAIWPRLQGLMDYCCQSVNEEGFFVGQPDDWTFVDWSDMDKTGAVCAEQMLFIKALEAAARCAALADADSSAYLARAKMLREKLDRFYFDEEQGGYIDSYESGLRHVTRHANIFAILFEIADERQVQSIVQNVLDNDRITPITTPYFKFYEMWANCKLGRTQEALQQVRSYWGGMIDLGATSIWEEYDPTQTFPRHYEMYGERYGKSLCHAWGAGPIYLLGTYVLGLSPTAPGYATFDVAPNPAGLPDFEGTLPLPDGEVFIRWKDERITVRASREGGTLHWQGQNLALPAGADITL